MNALVSRIKLYTRIFKKALSCVIERISNPNAVYLVLTPDHGNLGDHAIALAEHMLLEKEHIKTIEVTGRELQQRRELGLLRLMNGRTILVNGGGNLGTLWFSAEQLIRTIIQQNPRSAIFILPSTVFYENSEYGDQEKQRSIGIYNNHRNLTLFLREGISYQIASELYHDIAVKLMPDMAMYLNLCEPHFERHGCILSLRRDREKTMTAEQERLIKAQAEDLFGSYTYLDMVLDHGIPVEQRKQALQKQFDAFKRTELVITDRLHGMIFCAITGTPCVVIESKSHKVIGCYEWIKNLEYIRFCDGVEEISKVYSSMPKKELDYDNAELLHYYEDMLKSIKKAV